MNRRVLLAESGLAMAAIVAMAAAGGEVVDEGLLKARQRDRERTDGERWLTGHCRDGGLSNYQRGILARISVPGRPLRYRGGWTIGGERLDSQSCRLMEEHGWIEGEKAKHGRVYRLTEKGRGGLSDVKPQEGEGL